jgi:hypothetical protein
MDSRFYNAGDKIDEMFPFSLPDGADIHVIGRWTFQAPKESWISVPSELTVGSNMIHVDFAADVKRRFGKRGVVLLDPRHDPAVEDPDKPLEQYAIAPTEELVIERAEQLWSNYIEEMCRAHFEDVQNAMSSGGAPRKARGFTVHALKLKGYRDPAEDYFMGMKDGKAPQGTSPELVAMFQQQFQQNQTLMAIVLAMATGQKVDPELLKAVVPVPGTPQVPKPVVPSNGEQLEVEGQPRVGVEERINRREDTYTPRPARVAPRKQRTEAAAKAL